MKRTFWFVGFGAGAAILIAMIRSNFDQRNDADYLYAPAFITEPLPNQRKLITFPLRGQPTELVLPFVPSPITYGEDGRSIYAFQSHLDNAHKPGLFRITFSPLQAVLVPGSLGLSGDVAVSEDNNLVIVSGGSVGTENCGIFELRIADGSVRKIVASADCGYVSLWGRLSIAADGKRFLAYRKPHLELIDMVQGTIKSLGEEYFAASWSPDGK